MVYLSLGFSEISPVEEEVCNDRIITVYGHNGGHMDFINSLAPGRFKQNFKEEIFQLILVIDGWSISCKIILKWMPMDLTDDKSRLVQVMAWCHMATEIWVKIGSGNGLVPSGNKPLPEPILTQISVTIWHH